MKEGTNEGKNARGEGKVMRRKQCEDEGMCGSVERMMGWGNNETGKERSKGDKIKEGTMKGGIRGGKKERW